ncbi:MAG: spore gernimation protein [Firmicutes bacterium]|nr:spore gernimation protein [Bacillota bacterium]
MNKEVLSGKQAISLIVYAIIGDALIFTSGLLAGKDFWIAILVSILMAYFVFMVYARLISAFPGKDFFDILKLVLGSGMGKAVSIIYIWFLLHLGALVIRSFTEFIITVTLPETPIIAPLSCLILVCIWATKDGLELMGRLGKLFLIVMITITFITPLLLSKEWNLDFIRPVFYNGFQPIFNSAISTLAFPFAEAIICLFVFQSIRTKSISRVFTGGLLIAGAIVFITSLSEVLVLGVDAAQDYYFPAHNAVRKLNIGDFLQRLEIVVGVTFVVGGFIKTSLCILAVAKGVTKVFDLSDYRIIIIPVSILMANLSYIVYDNLTEMSKWPVKVWPFYALPFQVILPFLILVILQLRKEKIKNNEP